MRAVTLRDLRRLLARKPGARVRHTGWGVGVYWRDAGGHECWGTVIWPSSREPFAAETAADLDRLIARLGPDYSGPGTGKTRHNGEVKEDRPGGEFRPKGTDEVAPASAQAGDEDATVHGGDGNSGECAAPAQTSAAEPRAEGGGDHVQAGTGKPAGQQQPTSPDPGCGGGQDGATGAEPPRHTAGAPTKRGGKVTTGEVTEARGSPSVIEPNAGSELPGPTDRPDQPAPTADPSDAPGCDAPAGAGDGMPEEEVGEETAPVPDDGGTVTSSPLRPIDQWGGTFSDEKAAKLRRLAERRPAQEVLRALKKLIRVLDLGVTEQTPRLSGARLVRELVGKRTNLARARRVEADLPLVVLLCDVSQSCSAVCTDTLAACLAVADVMPNARVVRHSNGLLWEKDVEWNGDRDIVSFLRKEKRPVGLVVAFGDWDAGYHYKQLAEGGARLVWLDSYCARDGVRPASGTLREGAVSWKVQPLAWFQGVNRAATAAIALRQAARQAR